MQTNSPPNPFSQKTMHQVLKALGVEPGSAGFNQPGAEKTTQNVTDRSNSPPKTQANSPPNPLPRKTAYQFLTALGLEPGSAGCWPPMHAPKTKENDVNQGNPIPERP